ncbi:MAG: hypothetical protein E4G98_03835 [Promethearchaeota archaeon]|nr:MAG: hypothetical protein E4G98_03835 [Candidatus Lokiarchaeota archaeon]
MGNISKLTQFAVVGLLGIIALATIFNYTNVSDNFMTNFLAIATILLVMLGLGGVFLDPKESQRIMPIKNTK